MPKPNIVLIMTDQQRADFSKAEGFPLDTMPFLDSFAGRGARFRNAYTPMPVCGPARCSMLTGRYPKATRVRDNVSSKYMVRPADLADVLRDLGYAIALSGKNHSHVGPDRWDFFSHYGHSGGGRSERKSQDEAQFDSWLDALAHRVHPGPTPFPLEMQQPYRIVSDAIEFADTKRDDPFFLWLSFPEPHNPYQVPEPYFSLFPEDELPDRAAGPEALDAKGPKWRYERRMLETILPGYDERWRRYRSNYCGMIRLIDDQVRRFVEHLELAGMMENTIVIFTSDHGDFAGDYGLVRKGVELPECLTRVPLFVVGPGIVANRADRADFVSLVDLMPTLCEAVGARIPFGVQGRSLWPMLTGGSYPQEEFRSAYAEMGIGGAHYDEHDDAPLHSPMVRGGRSRITLDELNCVTQSGQLKMVRMGKWKLLFDMMGSGQLFDLETDPAELRNRFDEPGLADVQMDMMKELLAWTIRTEDDLPTGVYQPKRVPRNWLAG